jgi:uncharacterized membrane protein
MSFLLLITVASALAWIPQALLGDRRDLRMAMRHGLALGLIFTGLDHFVSAQTRYVPMIPQFLDSQALLLVHASGAAELLGAAALLMPAALYRRLGLPDLRPAAGLALAILFAMLVIANINVAVQRGGRPRVRAHLLPSPAVHAADLHPLGASCHRMAAAARGLALKSANRRAGVA